MTERNKNKGVGTGTCIAAVSIVGILSCAIVSIVSIMEDKPIIASFSGTSGLMLTIGARAVTGGKFG